MKLSIIAPAYFEEDVLPFFIERATKVCQSLVSGGTISDFEIIIVDDGSKDKTWRIIEESHNNDYHIKGLKFSRNFGHHIAITAGMDNANGDYIVLMDSDLQDEPEKIPEMIDKCKEGYQLVYAIRKTRDEGFFKTYASKKFYAVFNKICEIKIRPDVGIFRIMTKEVLENANLLREQGRFIHTITEWVGFNIGSILVDRPEREHGETKYSIRKMLKLAFTGITSFSTFPLTFAIYLGVIVSVLSFSLAGFFIIKKVFFDMGALEWPSLITTILFLGGVQLITIGIIGEYIGKIFLEVKKRPLYIVERKL